LMPLLFLLLLGLLFRRQPASLDRILLEDGEGADHLRDFVCGGVVRRTSISDRLRLSQKVSYSSQFCDASLFPRR
jgi:hypothetical protein